MTDGPRSRGRRKAKLAQPVDTLIDGKPVGRITAIELELDELAAAPEQTALELAGSAHDHVADVWAVYVEVHKPRNKALDPQTRALITKALTVATKTELCDAIRGCAASAFHMGQNDANKKYNKLSQIIKGKRGIRTDREQIDMMIDYLKNPSGVTSATQEKISRAKRDVRDSVQFPGDARLKSKAKEQQAWLEEQGWRVEHTDGTVRFHPPES